MKNPILCGVYAAINKQNGKRYIGSSRNIYDRWRSHKGKLRRNKHDTPHFQHAWNKYGEDAFEWVVLEYCFDDQLLLATREEVWIKKHKKKAYNSIHKPIARYYEPFTDQHRARISASHKGKKLGPRDTQPGAKITKSDVPEICRRYASGEDNESIAKDFGISFWSISDIAGRRTWKKVPVPKDIEEACLRRARSRKRDFPSIAMLNLEQVTEIKQRLVNGDPQSDLAREFGVSSGAIFAITKNLSYAYVPWPDSPNAPPRVKEKPACRGCNASLTDDQVREVRKLLSEGMNPHAIGAKLGISGGSVRQIRDGTTYRYVS